MPIHSLRSALMYQQNSDSLSLSLSFSRENSLLRISKPRFVSKCICKSFQEFSPISIHRLAILPPNTRHTLSPFLRRFGRGIGNESCPRASTAGLLFDMWIVICELYCCLCRNVSHRVASRWLALDGELSMVNNCKKAACNPSDPKTLGTL